MTIDMITISKLVRNPIQKAETFLPETEYIDSCEIIMTRCRFDVDLMYIGLEYACQQENLTSSTLLVMSCAQSVKLTIKISKYTKIETRLYHSLSFHQYKLRSSSYNKCTKHHQYI
eukprot:500963_1